MKRRSSRHAPKKLPRKKRKLKPKSVNARRPNRNESARQRPSAKPRKRKNARKSGVAQKKRNVNGKRSRLVKKPSASEKKLSGG